MIRYVIDTHTTPVPAVLEIPSKDHPYDPSKDSILRRAKGMLEIKELKPLVGTLMIFIRFTLKLYVCCF